MNVVFVGLVASFGLGLYTSPVIHAEESVEEVVVAEEPVVAGFIEEAILVEESFSEPTEGVYGKQVEPSTKNEWTDLEGVPENYTPESHARYKSWSYRPGVICIDDSRSSSGIIKHGHAGIMGIDGYKNSIIEANPGSGVSSFRSKFTKGKVWQVEVISTSRGQDDAAARWAGRQVGKGYNYNFANVNNRNSFYCSHLVWAAYKDAVGVNLNLGGIKHHWSAVHPSEFLSHPNTRLIYKNH